MLLYNHRRGEKEKKGKVKKMMKAIKVMKRMVEISNDVALYEEYINRYCEEKGLNPNEICADSERIKKEFSEWLSKTIIEEI